MAGRLPPGLHISRPLLDIDIARAQRRLKLVQGCYRVFTLSGLPASFIPDRSAQRLRFWNLQPTGQILERTHGLDVERVGRLDCDGGHMRSMAVTLRGRQAESDAAFWPRFPILGWLIPRRLSLPPLPASPENPAAQDRSSEGKTSRTVDPTRRGRRSTRAVRTPCRAALLAIAGLSSLAFAQPVYDVLRRAPEFFAIRDLYMGDLLALVTVLVAGPTLALSAPGIAARFLRPFWIQWAIAVPIGLLAALIALQAVGDLAALADRATWYPNATAAADTTEFAVPAMLSGSRPAPGQLSTATEHRTNLFTLLHPSHDVHALEPVTSLCPPEINLLATPRPAARERFALLVSDLSLVWLRLTVPSTWEGRVPAVTRAWSGFGREGPAAMTPPPIDQPVPFVNAIPPFKERPGLYFLHSPLPHLPWEYLPSGRRYQREGDGVHGLEREAWETTAWPALHCQKRYLLQVEFLDRLIGELIAHLKSSVCSSAA